MRFECQGISLWYGTDDAPAPGERVAAGTEVAITVGARPSNAHNKVELLYRINQGPTQKLDVPWLRSIHATQSQYFRAKFPVLSPGDQLDYTVICRCAGGQVPSPEEAKQFAASFRVVASQEMRRATPINQPDERQPNNPSSSSITESGDSTLASKGVVELEASTETHTQPMTSNTKDTTAETAATLSSHETRINTLNAILTAKEDHQTVKNELLAAKGDWAATVASLKDKLPEASLQKVTLAHSLADWSGDNVPVVEAVLAAQPDLTHLRDLALRFNVDKLAALVDPRAVPEATPGATAEEKQRNFAVGLRQKLFVVEPTAVLHRMVEDAEISIADEGVRSGVTQFLSNQPEFNIRTTSIYTALKHPEALKDIANEHQATVVDHVKTLQRVQAISPVPEAVPVLMKANLTSAFHVAQMPESTFLRTHGETLGEETARQVYTNAINNHVRNEHALITMRETMRGTGLAIIDGQRSIPDRIAVLQQVADAQAVPLNLETLFGSMDYCECDECLSVYSPAAYFVELLQFLRNNNLGPDPATGDPDPTHNKNIHPGIIGTPLEKLFRRRPDLGCLELTCENTFTVLPYIDLVNEVMESFVVHLGDYHNDTHNPKQATLEVFNVEGETTSELLAQPQHTNYEAYCILKSAVYPFTLPYHQPIDAMRIFLDYLKTSRCEVLDTYRTAKEICPNLTLSDADQLELQKLHKTVQDRAVDAEFLGLTQEEYIILTKEAFWPKRYFEITQKTSYTDDAYQYNIGVRQVCEYYGYASDADMLSTSENPYTSQGLTFVKKQFLPRTGLQYTDVVELLKTRFINPAYPQGEALTILESLRFSYRFLQTLTTPSNDPKIRFVQLIAFLQTWQSFVPQIEAFLHPDPCHPLQLDVCVETKDLAQWVYCYFGRIGKLIVLESGEGPQLPIEGQLFADSNNQVPAGTLRKDGTIVDLTGAALGQVTMTVGIYKGEGEVVDQQGNHIGWVDEGARKTLQVNAILTVAGPVIWHQQDFNTLHFTIKSNSETQGYIRREGRLEGQYENILFWLLVRDTCDLEKVRLTHLDGTSLTVDEYDRIHRFIRLWRKLGWTIDETDKALIGLSVDPGKSTASDVCDYVDFTSFSCPGSDTGTGCDCGSQQTSDWNCPDISQGHYDIMPAFLHQLAAVRKLLDSTGLPLLRLLTFWADISTAGEKSLYSRLFLTHNLLGIDKVFQADANGNYLTQPAKITDHLPVLMAALKLKADDIRTIMDFRQLGDSLTLNNVSVLYRHSLLAKLLHVRMTELVEVIRLFGDPFTEADQTLDLLHTWGKMEDAGFTFRQLNYVIRDHDDPIRPLAPTQRKLLQLTKTLYDGLNAIDQSNQDTHNKEDATADLVRTKAGLLFEQSVVEQIVGLLEGTRVYTTNAPAGQTITIKDADPLSKKLKYTDKKDAVPAFIQVTGILTEEEKTKAKALSNHADWSKAIDRVGKQAHHFFDDFLFGIFLHNKDDAIKNLLAGDVNVPPDPQNPAATDANTAPAKRYYFLQYFMPFLRERLYQRLIVDTTSGAAGLASDVTRLLLSEVLVVGTPSDSAMKVLEKIKDIPPGKSAAFKGYLIPTADDQYTFVAIADKPPAVSIDGQTIPFPHQQDDPSNVWSSDPVKLTAGKLYWLEVIKDQPDDQLQWKTATSPRATIPASALLPDYSSQGTKEAFVKLYKAGILVNGFGLTVDEISYWQTHPTDFDGFDFNTVTLQHWKRLQAYTDLRNNLPKYDMTLLDLFRWSSQKNDPKNLSVSAQIAAVTGWKTDNIDKLITPEHFDLNRREDFTNEINLVRLRNATIVADKIGVDIDHLFEWAKPGSKYWDCHQIAEDIRKAIRARFTEEDWEQVVKPLNDQLREHQKLALIAYLLVQPDLVRWGVIDADSLFEFFLIDVQMDACMETSRIKQAISTVQLFIQRCLLGLEEQYGFPNGALDSARWDWMQKYRVWEANRKVFLYPENWIEPPLRDDKSPFYKELESELLQKDINKQTVEDAMKNYLFKVDEVANLKVVGLFLDTEGRKLHVFSRTRNAPYFFYHRYFHTEEKNWYPWEKVQVDIPSYDVEDANGNITESGTYLIPVVWNKRLLIFFPQFVKKTKAQDPGSSVAVEQSGGKSSVPVKKPFEFWEIKMCWSEQRNGKWTQKQASSESICHMNSTPGVLPDPINSYKFIPNLFVNTDPRVVLDVYEDAGGDASALGAFIFSGSQIHKGSAITNKFSTFATDFHYTSSAPLKAPRIHSSESTALSSEPYFVEKTTKVLAHIDGKTPNFFHPFANELLGKMTSGDLDDLFDYYLNKVLDSDDAFGAYGASPGGKKLYHELKRSYALYNWEAAFHAPMLLADRLLKSQQFDRALKMCHYVFNPMAQGADAKRFWLFPPFKEVDAENVLEKLFMGLQPNTPDAPDGQINDWRNRPFQPHVVARSRPSAYMKWVVMKYIEILIAYGDYYFRQNTLETIPLAIQCYVLAAHIYGPRGQKIPKRGTIKPQTYNSLLDKWDAFGNAMVELELALPFSNQTPFPMGVSNGVVGLANVFGFATTLYFCIPDNPKLRGLRDTIDDRLFKIRHCQDIEGVFRKLPLFEPPIEPGLLVQAAAQGLSLSSVLNDLNSPMPNYRFYYLLQKALELCTELKALGNAFLSAKEKGDGEALSRLRATHESSIQNLVMEVRKQQLEESQKSVEALQQSRLGPVSRMHYYLKQIGEDLGKTPDANTDFSDLPNQVEQPVDESGLKLIQYEKEEMDKAARVADRQIDIGRIESIASILHAIPLMSADVKPIGIGVGLGWGGSNLGNATQAIARWMQTDTNQLSFEGTNAGRKANFLRQLQDRIQQANNAGFEIKNVDKQILTQQIRINIANQEITNQQKQIDNAQEVEDFLQNKYTNQELYSWMEGQIRTLYYQAYTLAYDLAKRAEKVFRFERGLTTSNFVQFGYWDAAYDGLLAGERLYIGLKQLEAAYQEKRGYDFEVSKPISLRHINPLALIELKETGTCEFALPEVLFDMDRPGDYMRRIKSVALTVPCVVGPYTSLNCTLRLLEHKFRTSSIVSGKGDYPEKTDETDERFSTVNIPITAIAASTGQNDSGVFDLNFRDERYIPFEGAGAISKWRLELPEGFRQFDYDTITEVVMQIRYTSLDGGDKLKKAAAESVQDYINSVEELSREEGLFAAFDLRHDFPNEWYKALQPPADATERVLSLSTLAERLPVFTKGRPPAKIQAADVYLFTPSALQASALVLAQGTDEFPFTDGPAVGTMKSFVAKDINCALSDWQIKIQDMKVEPDKLWLVARYVLL